ncbi:hypothetical protein SKAU_G00236540 [Synaphobranchus kaupii]|uniref:Uncharacterized protein n=1 Tax=Synaphobranchus kaupii TaxID=118154 RepID=A0A9Q1IRR8_SYNKA|nr:hypothetical protein SKAU_G00236540 [Synaphobranchus kaupii]
MDYGDISDKRKTALLRRCLGSEEQRIFRALGQAETYEEAVAVLTNHFTGQQRTRAPPRTTALCGYDSSKIEILGVLQVPVHYGPKHLPSFPFHIAKRGANLLGLDLFTGLGFTLRDDNRSDIHHVTSTRQQKWPVLFDGLGCLTDALRDDVTSELKMLLDS